jgi:GH24 family phage-related lysozyme (muramidase)
MYLDTVGKVTVGVGLMLPNLGTALALPFLLGDTPATTDEITEDFARVANMIPGRRPIFYHAPGSPQLSTNEIQTKLAKVVNAFDADLRAHFTTYDGMPDPAKLALLDMIYNLGPSGLFNGYSTLMKAVQAQDWTLAAAQCRRHGPSAARNTWTRTEFLAAATATPT